MAKSAHVELGTGAQLTRIPILHEDRSILAIDKPAGWMLIPFSWQRTNRNLQAALTSSIAAGEFWARSRNLKFLRFVHRLDAETTGILLFAKSRGAVDTFSELFETRAIEKAYLAVVIGVPTTEQWVCRSRLAPVPGSPGRMQVDPRRGKDAETFFRVLKTRPGASLIEARPVTGRTHQIRVHLAENGLPILGDRLYGAKEEAAGSSSYPLGLRAVRVQYVDPFTKRNVTIQAQDKAFREAFRFGG